MKSKKFVGILLGLTVVILVVLSIVSDAAIGPSDLSTEEDMLDSRAAIPGSSCSSSGNSSEYKFVKKWGNYGTANGEFRTPRGIAVDSLGNVYVADTKNNRIQKFTGEGVFIKKWGTIGTADGQLNSPVGLAVDLINNNVYVADTGNNRIQKFTDEGIFVKKWTTVQGVIKKFNTPEGIAVAPYEGAIYVADTGNNRVVVKPLNSDNFAPLLNPNLQLPYNFDLPIDVTFFSPNNFFVSEAGKHLIKKFNTPNVPVTQWEVTGANNGDPYFSPRGITSDTEGNVFVANTQVDEVNKYTGDGGFITKFGGTGQNDGQFRNMYDMAVDHLGNVYVVDTGNDRVQKFAPAKCGKIVINKVVVPTKSPQDFRFGRNFGLNFFLDDDSDPTLSNTISFDVPNNATETFYKVYELHGKFFGLISNFRLTSIHCVDPTGDTTTQIPDGILRAGTANIAISNSETVTCTFTNSI